MSQRAHTTEATFRANLSSLLLLALQPLIQREEVLLA